MNMTTSEAQKRAAKLYYERHKAELIEKRREYQRQYQKARYEEIKNDPIKRQERNLYLMSYKNRKEQTPTEYFAMYSFLINIIVCINNINKTTYKTMLPISNKISFGTCFFILGQPSTE